jgi:hypothetical protein
VGDTRNRYNISSRKPENFGYFDVDRRIILKWILVLRIGLICLRIRKKTPVSSKHVNETSGSVKDKKFLDKLKLLAPKGRILLHDSL